MPGELHPDPHAPAPAPESDADIEIETLDEALALALSMCPDGESVSLHEAHCKVTPEDPDRCNCTVQIFRPVRA